MLCIFTIWFHFYITLINVFLILEEWPFWLWLHFPPVVETYLAGLLYPDHLGPVGFIFIKSRRPATLKWWQHDCGAVECLCHHGASIILIPKRKAHSLSAMPQGHDFTDSILALCLIRTLKLYVHLYTDLVHWWLWSHVVCGWWMGRYVSKSWG